MLRIRSESASAGILFRVPEERPRLPGSLLALVPLLGITLHDDQRGGSWTVKLPSKTFSLMEVVGLNASMK